MESYPKGWERESAAQQAQNAIYDEYNNRDEAVS